MGQTSQNKLCSPEELALFALLEPHKEAMAERWANVVHGTYPFGTIGFLRTQKNQFTNPVGYRTAEAAKELVNVIFTPEPDTGVLEKAIEEITRVRSIQEFSPETAVGVFFALKDIVRKIVFASEQKSKYFEALCALESRIDAVVLLAFGSHARSREQLHLLKVEEFKRSHSQVLRLAMQKAGMHS